jgi:hypothetical protein
VKNTPQFQIEGFTRKEKKQYNCTEEVINNVQPDEAALKAL